MGRGTLCRPGLPPLHRGHAKPSRACILRMTVGATRLASTILSFVLMRRPGGKVRVGWGGAAAVVGQWTAAERSAGDGRGLGVSLLQGLQLVGAPGGSAPLPLVTPAQGWRSLCCRGRLFEKLQLLGLGFVHLFFACM